MRGLSSFVILAAIIVILAVVLGYFASQQPRLCDPEVWKVLENIEKNATNLGAAGTTALEKLAEAKGSFAAGNCELAKAQGLEAHGLLGSVQQIQQPQPVVEEQPVTEQPAVARTIMIESVVDTVFNVKNTGGAAILASEIAVYVNSTQTECMWSSPSISPNDFATCSLPEPCAGKIIEVEGPENSDSAECY